MDTAMAMMETNESMSIIVRSASTIVAGTLGNDCWISAKISLRRSTVRYESSSWSKMA